MRGLKSNRPPVAMGGARAQVGLLFVSRRWHGAYAGRGDVFGVLVFEDAFRAVFLFAVIGMNGDEMAALFQLLLVTLGFDLGNAEVDDAANDSARSRAAGAWLA